MKKIAIAFTWSMLLAGLAGLFIGAALAGLGIDWYYGPGATLALTVFHAWLQSRSMLLAALGDKKGPQVIASSRSIPVTAGGVMARFESSIGRGRTLELPISDEITILTPTGVVIDSDRIKSFVGRAISRQAAGLPPLSRPYWTKRHRPPMDRECYDTMMSVLMAAGCVSGRVQGKSGRIQGDYRAVIEMIKNALA